MTRWQHFKTWLRGDLCNTCGDGEVQLVGQSGVSYIKLHYRCDRCGAQYVYVHHPGD